MAVHTDGRRADADGFTGETMRVTLALLGWELDLTLGPATADETAAMDATTDRGYFTSQPISFTAWPVPEEIPIQPHTPAWDEPEERGQ